MVAVYCSKFTPGVKASDTKFSVDEVVTYRLPSGTEVKVTIKSDIMFHEEAKCVSLSGFGYEGIFSDTGQVSFAAVENIVDWEGKTSSVAQVKALMARA